MNLALMVAASHRLRDRDDEMVKLLRHAPAVRGKERTILAALATALLEETGSDRVRNAAAILLTDIIGRDAAASIIGVLQRPQIAPAAGTLLYALNEVGAKLPLPLVVAMVEHGSFEARGEALTFLEDGRIETPSPEDLTRAARSFETLQDAVDESGAAQAAVLGLEYLHHLTPA